MGRRPIVINADLKANYHTHSTYCDGKDSLRDMVEAAVSLGFVELGFSGHQWSEADCDYAMSPDNTKRYISEIAELRDEYSGKIGIFTGIERGYVSPDRDNSAFDYVIASVHNAGTEDRVFAVDNTEEIMLEGVRDVFGGDVMEYIKDYYRREARVLTLARGHIAGHFDLVTKFNENGRLFDESDAAYRRAALSALDEAVETYAGTGIPDEHSGRMPLALRLALESGKPIFEINLGAMARGYRTVPYPAPFIIKELIRREVPLLISTDCHDSRYLDYRMKWAMSLLDSLAREV